MSTPKKRLEIANNLNQELWEEVEIRTIPETDEQEQKVNKQYELDRMSKLLQEKVKRNQVAREYYKIIKVALEDILMLELAQSSVEANLRATTYNSVFPVNNRNLFVFRQEMEKIKQLKLVNALLPIASVPEEQNQIIYSTINKLYNDSKDQEQNNKSTKNLEQLLIKYVNDIKNLVTTNVSNKKEK